jgi:hypothetical protein
MLSASKVDFNFADVSVFSPETQPNNDLRASVGNLHGYDLSSVQIHNSSPALVGSGLEALTYGSDIHLRSGLDTNSSYGQRILAHELTHTVQQATNQTGTYNELEQDAVQHSEQVLESPKAQSSSLPALPSVSNPAPQAFDPRFHRESVVEGLSTSGVVGDGVGGTREYGASGFSPEEIGMIYQANWERDLSQLHPSVAEAMLAWKDVKIAAVSDSEGREQRVSEAETGFQTASSNVLNTLEQLGLDEFLQMRAYNGYSFWEHMDNPGSYINYTMSRRSVELGIPSDVQNPHLFVAKEYIKEMLFDAIRLAHPDAPLEGHAADSARDSHDRRNSLHRLELDYDHTSGDATSVEGTRPTSTIATETAMQVRQAHPDAPAATPGAAAIPAEAFEKLGRASHSLEDFWSHSNFVEMAVGEARFNSGLSDLETANTSRESNPATQGLTTSTFDEADMAHSKAHKIRSLADEIDAELPLIEHMMGRSSVLPSASDVRVGETALPTPEDHDDESGRFGDFLRAQQQVGFFDTFIRNPATLGAGAGGYVGGGLREEEEGILTGMTAMTLGTLGGGVIGLGTGFTGGIMAGGDYFENELDLGWVGGGVGAVLGGFLGGVTGTVGGIVGGFGGSSSGYHSDSHTGVGGAVAGARLFGDDNLMAVASSLGASRAGVALLHSVAENMENESRDAIANDPNRAIVGRAAGSHSLLAKDQPGHDDSSQDILRTRKFELARALSIASDRMVIGQMRAALTNPDPAAAMAQLEAIDQTIDTLIASPNASHPLYGIIEEHRQAIEEALTAHYQTQGAAAATMTR